MKKWAVLLSLLLASCVGFAKIGPGPTVIRERLEVHLDSAWNKFQGAGGSNRTEFWTTDGVTLDTLTFYVGIREGEKLVEVPQRSEKSLPRFKAAMLPHEIAEMYEAYAVQDGSLFRLDRIAPAPFAGAEGFRFEFTLMRKSDELELRGAGWGTVKEGQLHLMVYRAPRLHYFTKHLPRVEQIARTARFKP